MVLDLSLIIIIVIGVRPRAYRQEFPSLRRGNLLIPSARALRHIAHAGADTRCATVDAERSNCKSEPQTHLFRTEFETFPVT